MLEFRAVASVGASLVAVESNHDIHKLRFGPYPESLKTRILSRWGHLSNNAACDLILAHALEHGPACFWLSHLSEVNNTPRMAMNYWKKGYGRRGCGRACRRRGRPARQALAGVPHPLPRRSVGFILTIQLILTSSTSNSRVAFGDRRPGGGRAIGKVAGDRWLTLPAHLHTCHALIPSGNNFPGTDGKRE